MHQGQRHRPMSGREQGFGRWEIDVESGYPPNSKSDIYWKPKWRDSWHIPVREGGFSKGAQVFVGSDYCLYNGDWLTQSKVFSTSELHTILFIHLYLQQDEEKTNLLLTYGVQSRNRLCQVLL